ncbi:MAG: hypothetical protein RKO25_00965, partial [Candidatus Contendobacter sp.]|nr:hypothetical protein [Candidatus Contendobacter sp.]
MYTPRNCIERGVVRSFLGLCLSLLLASAAWGQATSAEYQILLDTDSKYPPAEPGALVREPLE